MRPKLYGYKEYRFLIIAHRGASYYRPENTFSSFEEAVRMGADMIELDVLFTKDNVPVVIHDENLSRLAGTNENISNLTIAQLRRAEVGSWFDNKFKGEQIPTLTEMLNWAKGKISLNIEVKTEAVSDSPERGVEKEVINLIRQFKMESHVLLSSFDVRALIRFKTLAPEIPSGYLYSRGTSKGKTIPQIVNEFSADFYHTTSRSLTNRRHKQLQEVECPVMVYTVNSKREMKKLIQKGVFGIFSDKPDHLKEVADKEIPDRLR